MDNLMLAEMKKYFVVFGVAWVILVAGLTDIIAGFFRDVMVLNDHLWLCYILLSAPAIVFIYIGFFDLFRRKLGDVSSHILSFILSCLAMFLALLFGLFLLVRWAV